MIFTKASVLGLLGTLTLATSVVPAYAHHDQNRAFDFDQSNCKSNVGYLRRACFSDADRDEFSDRPSDCRINSAYVITQSCKSLLKQDLTRYKDPVHKGSPFRVRDKDLPPCGIVYNGPCDPKKGI
jgi:hypothetical protein